MPGAHKVIEPTPPLRGFSAHADVRQKHKMASKSYRKIALQEYDSRCVHCGFGIEAVLEVAHKITTGTTIELRI